MEQLILTLKSDIIDALNLDCKPEEIVNDAPLFGTGLGLDSIDALELIVLLDKKYSIKITDPVLARKIFASINTLAEFIHSHRK